MTGLGIAIRIAAVLGVALVAGAAWLYTPDLSRAELMKRYGTAADQDLDVLGLRVRLRDTGPKSAPALVMLHGFGSSLDTFEAWAGPLSDRYRVVRYDLPGFGLTGPEPGGDYSDARGLAVLAAVMDRLGIERATILGNSMGGRLAFTFAAAHPERTSKLVLVSPDGFASPGFQYGKAPEVPLAFRLLPYLLPKPMIRSSLLPAYGDPARLSDAVVERYRDMMLAPGVRRAILDRMAQTVLRDPGPTLRRVSAPTLLIWGERDGMIPIRNAEDYLRALPRSRLARLPGAGHVPYEESPNVSLPLLEAFLAAPA